MSVSLRARCAVAFVALVGGLSVCPATAGATTSASTSGAAITAIYFDSPGPDYRSAASLDAEWIRIKNVTTTRKTLTGWTVSDWSGHTYHFPTFSLAAGASVRVHTGSGTNTTSNLYWRSGNYIWNNTGDTAYLRNAAGTQRDTCVYSSKADPEATC